MNEYERKQAQIYLIKEVSGNLGDRSAEFHFTVTVKDGSNDITIEGITDTDIIRKHGYTSEQNLLGTFPVGATVTIKETIVDGYKTTVKEGNEEEKSGSEIVFTVDEAGNTVTFKNDKTIEIDTGVPVDQMPYLMMIAAVMLLGVVSLVGYRSRKKRFE